MWHNSKWFQLAWDERSEYAHRSKGADPNHYRWGSAWKGRRVLAHRDNIAVVAVLNSRYNSLMQMLRCPFFIEAQHQFSLFTTHIAGINNGLADDLSRNN